jgi:hypothetical protein
MLRGCAVAAMLGTMVGLPALRAQGPAPTTSPANKTPVAPLTSTAAIPPATPDTNNPYGKIVVPGDMAHPPKLKLPIPDTGEVKVPTPDEIAMRVKLETLAALSDNEIHTQLEQWPAYSTMTLRDQGAMLMRIQDFRDYRTRTAVQAAHDMGLMALTPDQRVKFEKDYWDKRLKMDVELAKQFGPAFKARQQKLADELVREFSTGVGAIAQGPKAPVVPVPAVKPGAVGEAPVAQAPR